jgi:hypothetical protein
MDQKQLQQNINEWLAPDGLKLEYSLVINVWIIRRKGGACLFVLHDGFYSAVKLLAWRTKYGKRD